MSDGYGSGGISQDADGVLGLYPPFKYGEGRERTLWVFVLKARIGGAANPQKPAELTFTETGKLSDYSDKGDEYGQHYASKM